MCGEGPPQYVGAEQLCRRVDHCADSEELLGDSAVSFGDGQQSPHVGVRDAERRGTGALYLRQGEVAADRELPGNVDRFGRGAEVSSRQIVAS